MGWITRHPYLVLIAAIALTLAAGAGLQRAVFIADFEVFFDGDNEHLRAHQEMERTYARADNFAFIVDPKEGDMFSRDALKALAWLADEAWEIPRATGMTSLSNYQYVTAADDELIVEDLFDDIDSLSDDDIAERKAFSLTEPAVGNRLISLDGKTAVVVTLVDLTAQGVDENTRVVRAGEAIAARFAERFPYMTVRLSGSTTVSQGFTDGATSDVSRIVPLMYMVILIVSGLILRSGWAVVAILIVVMGAVVAAEGLAAWMGVPLTSLSISAPTIIMTIAVATSIHLLAGVLRRMRAGAPKLEALLGACEANLMPVSLTCTTTAIGLMALMLSDVPPYRYLGITSGLGALLTFVFAYTLIPALLTAVPMKVRVRTEGGGDFWDRIGDFVVRRRLPLFVTLAAAAVILISFIPRNEINDGLVRYFDEDLKVRQDALYYNSRLGGFYFVDFSFRATGEGGVHEPEYLRYVEAFSNWANGQPHISSVDSLNITYKRLNQVMHADDPSWYRLPETRELAAQYLLMYQMSLPKGIDLTDAVNVGYDATRVAVGFYNVTNREVREFNTQASLWIAENMPDYMQTIGSGGVIMFANLWNATAKGSLLGGLIAVVLIALVLIFALGGPKLGLMSLLPNLLPAGVVFGLWGVVNGQVDIASASVAIVTLGIVVDDTIHFLTRYRRARTDQGASPEDAVRYAFRSVGAALAITSAVLVAGFLVLAQSLITLNSTLGVLSALIIVTALTLDFFLLPPLLMFIDNLGGSRRGQEATAAAE